MDTRLLREQLEAHAEADAETETRDANATRGGGPSYAALAQEAELRGRGDAAMPPELLAQLGPALELAGELPGAEVGVEQGADGATLVPDLEAEAGAERAAGALEDEAIGAEVAGWLLARQAEELRLLADDEGPTRRRPATAPRAKAPEPTPDAGAVTEATVTEATVTEAK